MSAASKRRIMLVNPRFQLRFMGFIAVLVLIAVTAFYSANMYFFAQAEEAGRALGLATDHVYYALVEQQRRLMTIVYVVTSVLSFVTIGLLGLVMSHRVAGPLYRLHRHMVAVSRGETRQEVHFRRFDYFQEIAEAYNEQLKALTKGGDGRHDC